MYHPAAALRTPAIEEASFADVALVPRVLEEARAHRAGARGGAAAWPPDSAEAPVPDPASAAALDPAAAAGSPPPPTATPPDPAVPLEPEPPAVDQLTLFR
jgi:hypothetical protein